MLMVSIHFTASDLANFKVVPQQIFMERCRFRYMLQVLRQDHQLAQSATQDYDIVFINVADPPTLTTSNQTLNEDQNITSGIALGLGITLGRSSRRSISHYGWQ